MISLRTKTNIFLAAAGISLLSFRYLQHIHIAFVRGAFSNLCTDVIQSAHKFVLTGDFLGHFQWLTHLRE